MHLTSAIGLPLVILVVLEPLDLMARLAALGSAPLPPTVQT
jgi:hypothetical protein